MSELDGNEERARGRADSLNFVEVIPSSLRENHLRKTILPLPARTCGVVCVGGSSTGAILGENCSIFFGQEVTLHSWGNWKPSENE